ncbi:NgoPII family restriction endonuclease [Priestia megaterium]|uniref:NgoPII family restriction endonuclease n=1 Tax=Priestia megaterium TaxID=1404 RepID=UPI0025B14599|nr:NgoPII family restriction endonuclease [Priestia megaterium]MDN3233108.1 NgoPII family restriction endonuclease [Priestia megaterium]
MGYVPSSNVLIALYNILSRKQNKLSKVVNHISNNRVNSTGDLLEYYVKDAFCGISADLEMTDDKLKEYQQTFSYLGNSNNPPDFVVRHGVGVEVKKIERRNTNGIALNSSFPKDYLYHDDLRIKKECRECEAEFGGWTKKDMIYAVGNVTGDHLHSLWLIYGDCYCADKATYQRIADTIKTGVSSIPGVEFGETKELGRINRVDPLGITYLRIRGMWGIEHPSAVFRSLLNNDADPTKTHINVLMRKETYDQISDKPDFTHFLENGMLTIRDVKIPNPNNPAQNLEAILYSSIL